MPALGKGNPIPFKLGGGPSNTEQANTAIKDIVGIGGSSPDGTIRAEWFLAKARGLAAVMADERALNQGFPDLATDALLVYEEILSRPAAPDESDQERRDLNTALWTSTAPSIEDELTTSLQAIDENFVILYIPVNNTITTQNGRGFQDWDPTSPKASGPPFNIGDQSEYPNYSTDYRVYVQYNVTGTLTTQQFQNLTDAKNLLRDRLPSWIDFTIFKEIGFILDIDLLDLTSFGNILSLLSTLTFARAGESNISIENKYEGPFASGVKAIIEI